jgi:hypothetical protein
MVIGDPETFECTNSTGVYPVPSLEIIGTELEGYEEISRYLENLERENKQLRRRCKIK